MVVSYSKAKDVILVGFAPVVLNLMVRLHGCLRRQEVRSGAEVVQSRGKAESVPADGKLNSGRRIENAGAGHRVRDPVLELRVAEANAVREGSTVEISAHNMGPRVVHVGKRLEGVG